MEMLFDKYTNPDNCKTQNDVYSRYQRLDNLYTYLKKGGRFKSQEQLLKEHRGGGDIYIHIGRENNLIFGGGGCHRLAIAKILKLKSIPALLGIVHLEAIKNWHQVAG